MSEKLNEFKLEMVSELPDFGDNELNYGVLYIRKDLKSICFLCPCGNGEYIRLPLSPKHWQIEVKDNKATVTPSISIQPCGAHYFIRENKIKWC